MVSVALRGTVLPHTANAATAKLAILKTPFKSCPPTSKFIVGGEWRRGAPGEKARAGAAAADAGRRGGHAAAVRRQSRGQLAHLASWQVLAETGHWGAASRGDRISYRRPSASRQLAQHSALCTRLGLFFDRVRTATAYSECN